MKTKLAVALVVVLLVAVTVTAFAATYLWKQGYTARLGAGQVTSSWFADLQGTLRTDTKVVRQVEDPRYQTEGWAEAMVCKSITPKKGLYKITAYVPIKGNLYAKRYAPGWDAEATASISTMIKVWQGTYENTAAHKFQNTIASVRTWRKATGEKSASLDAIYTQTVNYPVTYTNLPLKICIGKHSYGRVHGLGIARSEFTATYSAMPLARMEVQYIP